MKRLSAIAAGLAIAGFGLFAIGREAPTPAPADPPPPAAEKPVARIAKVIPKPDPPLRRGDVIAAASRAADAYAGGGPLPEGNAAIVGRMFSLRIPFGCGGPLPEDTGKVSKSSSRPIRTGWRYTESNRALQLLFAIEDWTKADWIAPLAGDTPRDQVEGFWLDRPWTASEACPAATTADEEESGQPNAPVERSLGIAQFFEPGAPRTLQRGGRPYSTTLKRDAAPDANAHFVLTVEGRIAAYADGQPVHCRAALPGLRPTCLVATQITALAFEDPATGEILARWTR